MSRGLGPCQRAVLDAARAAVDPDTGRTRWVSVEDVAKGSHPQRLDHAGRELIRRAMRTLADRGLVEIGDIHRGRSVVAVRMPAPLDQLIAEYPACNARNWRDLHARAIAARQETP